MFYDTQPSNAQRLALHLGEALKLNAHKDKRQFFMWTAHGSCCYKLPALWQGLVLRQTPMQTVPSICCTLVQKASKNQSPLTTICSMLIQLFYPSLWSLVALLSFTILYKVGKYQSPQTTMYSMLIQLCYSSLLSLLVIATHTIHYKPIKDQCPFTGMWSMLIQLCVSLS